MVTDPGIKPSTMKKKKKNSDPLIAHKEKLKEDLKWYYDQNFAFPFLFIFGSQKC